MNWGIKGTDTVVILRATEDGVDSYNNPVFSEEEITVNKCLVEYSVSEVNQTLFKDVSNIDLIVHFPVGTKIYENDNFRYLEEDYRLSKLPIIRSRMVGSPIPKKVIVGLERVDG